MKIICSIFITFFLTACGVDVMTAQSTQAMVATQQAKSGLENKQKVEKIVDDMNVKIEDKTKELDAVK